jgi:dolichyl-phosphate-mannose--protein O-mannosyl transferase
MLAIITVVHLGIWMIFFGRLPVRQNIPFSIYEKLYVQIEYPAMNNNFDILKYLPVHFVHMFGANTVYQQHESASHPWEWLLGRGKIPIFINPAKNAVIVLSGNQIGWLTIPGTLLFGWVILSGPRREKWLSISKEHLSVIVWAFVLFFVPFLFVGRVVFLYHYFSALLCGYLLVPIVIEFGMHKWADG